MFPLLGKLVFTAGRPAGCLSRITGFIVVFITETTNVSSSEKMYPLVLKLVLTGCFEYNFIGKIDLIKLYRNLQLVNPKYLI